MTDVPTDRAAHHSIVQITISLEAFAPPEGTVLLATGAPLRFQGWLGLLQVLSEAVQTASSDGQPVVAVVDSGEKGDTI